MKTIDKVDSDAITLILTVDLMNRQEYENLWPNKEKRELAKIYQKKYRNITYSDIISKIGGKETGELISKIVDDRIEFVSAMQKIIAEDDRQVCSICRSSDIEKTITFYISKLIESKFDKRNLILSLVISLIALPLIGWVSLTQERKNLLKQSN